MKLKQTLILIIVLILSVPVFSANKIKINNNWKFFYGDMPCAINNDYSDNLWRTINIPHDWAFENGYSVTGVQGVRGSYASGGVGWYRKMINITSNELDSKQFFLDFDGIYMNSEVWVNGQYMGKRPYGYISFSYNVTKALHPGKNLVSIRVDNSLEPSARWYHGCGIYGDVFLRSTSPIHFIKDGTSITTENTLTNKATVNIKTSIANAKFSKKSENFKNITLSVDMLDTEGNIIASTKKKKQTLKMDKTTLSMSFNVKNFKLWDPKNPNLYSIEMKISEGNKTIDSQNIRIGFRDIKWSIENGFILNGKQTKLYGVCDHLEAGPVGAMSTEKLLRWKIQLLKDMGCNAIRTSHNPQIPIFYDLCDEMGILVLDEIFDGWSRKAPFDYGEQAYEEWWKRDLASFINRDRNHPSIFAYSVGNETHTSASKDLVKFCHELDSTRKVTSGGAETQDMDIRGENGGSGKQSFLNTFKPTTQPFLATENPHTFQTRGVYFTQSWFRDGYSKEHQIIPNLTDKEIFTCELNPSKKVNRRNNFNSSYDNSVVRVSSRYILAYMRDHNWFSGSFRWTGFDYLGESGVHGGWPFRAFQGGPLDLAGFKKDLYYLYQSEWTDKPMIHILPHWTHPNMKLGTKIPVWVYTNGDEVELIVNGTSLGRKKKGEKWNELQCQWLVPWAPGQVQAIAYKNGQEIARETIKTSGAPTKIAIEKPHEELKNDFEDIAIVTIKQEDAKGNFYPYGENRIYTKIYGNARMLSFESGNSADDETNFNAANHNCFMGLNRMFIQSTGGNKNSPVSILIASINGDKRLKLSNKVTIDVHEIALRGKNPKRNLRITYTTNGRSPKYNSTIYDGPFNIKMGQTVRAAIFDGKRLILNMEEKFTKNEGLYLTTENTTKRK